MVLLCGLVEFFVINAQEVEVGSVPYKTDTVLKGGSRFKIKKSCCSVTGMLAPLLASARHVSVAARNCFFIR